MANSHFGSAAVGLSPNGRTFVTRALTDDFRVGFGLHSNFGLAEKWQDDWVGRYYTQQSAPLGISFTPAIAYRIIDGLSIWAGLNVMYGYLKQTVAVNRGPLAGQVAGAYTNSWIQFLTLNATWKF